MAESKLFNFSLDDSPYDFIKAKWRFILVTRFPQILEIWTCCLSHILEREMIEAMFSMYEYIVRIITIYDVCSVYMNDNIIYIF